MRNDVLKLITESKDINDVIILTYNVDLMFIQSMLLPKLKNCGHPNLLIFSDINRATESFQSQHKWVQGIGSRYRLVPVSLVKNGSFHPKAILLSSEEKATLLIGSGNLSFAGWRENGETWIGYDSDTPIEKAVFSAFHDYLKELIQLIPLNASIAESIKNIYANKWASDLPQSNILLGRIQSGPRLIEKMFGNIDLVGLQRITICTPFFDSDGEMVRDIYKRSGHIPTRVLVQNKKTNLTYQSAQKMPKEINVLPVEFFHEDTERHSFLHSKFYAFEKKNTVEVFIGSANCSRAALKASGENGNAELLTKITLTKDEYKNLLVNELEFVDSELVLPNEDEQEDEILSESSIKILAARQSGSKIRIAYRLPASFKLVACYINDEKHHFKIIDKGQISVTVSFNPYKVYIEAANKDVTVQSPICWVDDEIELQITSRDRKLANTIDARIKYGEWSISGWIEIMRLIHSNLDYESNLQSRKYINTSNKEDSNEKKKFKYDDIFSNDFDVSAKHYSVNAKSEYERLQGFQQMLLSWFGVGWKSDFYNENTEEQEEDDSDKNQNGIGGKPKKRVPKTKKSHVVKKEDKDRALRVAKRIIAKITSPEFLGSRPPRLLGIDLSIVGTLLCSGLSEKWLRSEDFFELSYKIWHTLFFDANIVINKHGWIEKLYDEAQDSTEFENEISSVELSSILIMWVLAAQHTKRSSKKVLFLLAYITSISRTPWLWNVDEMNKIIQRLWQNLINIKMINNEDGDNLPEIERNLKTILRRGIASKKLFDFLNVAKMTELRSQISRDRLKEGEILWQGSKHGFCILGESCERSTNNTVNVLSLNNPQKEVAFVSGFLLPVKDLLNNGAIPLNLIGKKERNVLFEIFEEISNGYDSR